MIEDKTLSVLLVDDDQDDRSLFQDALERINIPVSFKEASGCNEALEKLKEMEELLPDIIFIDLNMPDIDGFKCIEGIKKVALWKNIPIIVYSTSSSSSHIKQAEMMGVTGYLKKPNQFKEFCTKLEGILAMDLAGTKEYLGYIE